MPLKTGQNRVWRHICKNDTLDVASNFRPTRGQNTAKHRANILVTLLLCPAAIFYGPPRFPPTGNQNAHNSDQAPIICSIALATERRYN